MVTRSTSSFGCLTDWQQRINWDRLRKYRLNRAREAMKRNGLGALLVMYDENVRYITSTVTPGWCRSRAYAMRSSAKALSPCSSAR